MSGLYAHLIMDWAPRTESPRIRAREAAVDGFSTRTADENEDEYLPGPKKGSSAKLELSPRAGIGEGDEQNTCRNDQQSVGDAVAGFLVAGSNVAIWPEIINMTGINRAVATSTLTINPSLTTHSDDSASTRIAATQFSVWARPASALHPGPRSVSTTLFLSRLCRRMSVGRQVHDGRPVSGDRRRDFGGSRPGSARPTRPARIRRLAGAPSRRRDG